MDSPEGQRLAAVAGARAAHRQLIEGIDALTDEQARSPSLLPGWSVGHVLTHIARNGDAFARMMSAAIDSRAVSQYDGGDDRRTADIDAGAGRPATALVADVTDSAMRLEAVWDAMTPDAWAGHGLNASGATWPCEAMPFHRWREVVVHHGDLGLGYTPTDWPDDYVDRELAISLRSLGERLAPVDRARMLAWLLGRADQPDLTLAPGKFRTDQYLR